jgi:hypothetical protein
MIELPTVEIRNGEIIFHNLLRSNGTEKVIMTKAEALLYYIELYKFIINELPATEVKSK